MSSSGFRSSEVLHAGLRLAQQVKQAVETDALRKADPSQRTALDLLVAVLTLVFTLALVLSCIGLGWWVLWRTTLHKIGVFRDIMGLNRAAKADAKRRAEAEIRALKAQLSQQHGFGQPAQPSAPGHRKGD